MSSPIRLCIPVVLFALAVSVASCGKAKKASELSATSDVTTKQTAAPRTFSSPAEASAALFDAAKAGDQTALLAIFGTEGKEMLFSGDAVEDKNNREHFLRKYNEMNRWSTNKNGGETLFIGADNFPFPVPLKKNAAGQWSFDTENGKKEVLARRIGNNELTTINVLGDVAGAQARYYSTHGKQYAQKFISDPGQQNGLYWDAPQGQPPSPLGPLVDFAKTLGYGDKPKMFNGYYYRLLTRQGAAAKGGARDYMADGKLSGGFAVIAYPAIYGDSGIMTFTVGRDGVVYQRDLGDKTGETAPTLAEFNPDQNWAALSAEPIQGPSGPETKTAPQLRASAPK